jgi:hypothetical protein
MARRGAEGADQVARARAQRDDLGEAAMGQGELFLLDAEIVADPAQVAGRGAGAAVQVLGELLAVDVHRSAGLGDRGRVAAHQLEVADEVVVHWRKMLAQARARRKREIRVRWRQRMTRRLTSVLVLHRRMTCVHNLYTTRTQAVHTQG